MFDPYEVFARWSDPVYLEYKSNPDKALKHPVFSRISDNVEDPKTYYNGIIYKTIMYKVRNDIKLEKDEMFNAYRAMFADKKTRASNIYKKFMDIKEFVTNNTETYPCDIFIAKLPKMPRQSKPNIKSLMSRFPFKTREECKSKATGKPYYIKKSDLIKMIQDEPVIRTKFKRPLSSYTKEEACDILFD